MSVIETIDWSNIITKKKLIGLFKNIELLKP